MAEGSKNWKTQGGFTGGKSDGQLRLLTVRDPKSQPDVSLLAVSVEFKF